MNLASQQKIRIGTCAWSFDDWRGGFYPEQWPAHRWIEFYAQHLPAVEIDSTFYAVPALETVQRWVEITPASFRFACKLPRAITHERGLVDCATELLTFCHALELLTPKLGPVLIQLPATFSPRENGRALRAFLRLLPRDFRWAIEFRHPGWHRPQVIRLLEKHRVCWAWVDASSLSERNQAPFEFLPQTTDFLYLRLLGDQGTKWKADGERVHRYSHLLWKREAALESWALRIERHLEETRSIWTFANNHYEGYAPETCQRLAARLGYELTPPRTDSITLAAENGAGQLELFGAAQGEM